MKSRLRLVLFGVAVTAAAMLVFGVLLGALGNASTRSEQQASLEAYASDVVASLSSTTPEDLSRVDPPVVVVDPATSTDIYYVVVTEEGRPLYSSGVDSGTDPIVPQLLIDDALLDLDGASGTHVWSGTQVQLAAQRWGDGPQSVVVIAAQSVAFAEERSAGLGAALIIAAFFALLAAAGVGWMVSGRALRPLQELVVTTEAIRATGDISQRLPPARSRDEIGALTVSFNGMLDRIETSQRQREAALDAQQQFVADASHELRSPLTTIRANAGFLRERPDASEQDRVEAISDIAEEADRMAALTESLLALARGDSDGAVARSLIDLGAVVEGLERRAESLEQTVVFDIERPVIVRGDADSLERTTWILIDNAASHGASAVAVIVRINDDEAELRVTDDGPGFPGRALGQVFDRFYRGDKARSGSGSGLGLAIASDVVEAHGGRIGATNRPEGGASVTVRLPLVT